MRKVIQKWFKGINRRFNVEEGDDPTRLYVAKNARLQKRGDTGQVTRIKGLSDIEPKQKVGSIQVSNVVDLSVGVNETSNVVNGGTTSGFLVESFSYGVTSMTFPLSGVSSNRTENGNLGLMEKTWSQVVVGDKYVKLSYDYTLSEFDGGLVGDLACGATITDSLGNNINELFRNPNDSNSIVGSVTSGWVYIPPLTDLTLTFSLLAPTGGVTTSDIVGGAVISNIELLTRPNLIEEYDIIISDSDVIAPELWTIPISYDTTGIDITSVRDIIYSKLLSHATLTDRFVVVKVGDDTINLYDTVNDDVIWCFNTIGTIEYTTLDFIMFSINDVAIINIVDIISINDQLIIACVEENGNDDIVTFYSYRLTNERTVTIGSITFDGVPFRIKKNYKLIKGEDVVYFAPYNIQLYNVGNNFVLNKFSSITPKILTVVIGSDGGLQTLDIYWYKVAYRYFDGHQTMTSFPYYVDIGINNKVTLTLSVDNDLNGEYAFVELYRKQGAGDWGLIKRINPNEYDVVNGSFDFVDDGLSIIGADNTQSYVWHDYYQTHTFVRDRLVRAGLDYNSVAFNFDANISTIMSNQTYISGFAGVPQNTIVNVYARKKKINGTNTLLSNVGTLVTSDDENIELNVHQNSVVDDGVEIGYFATFEPNKSTDTIDFGTLEVYNSHVPSIETSNEIETLQDRPLQPHIFLGWKYLYVSIIDTTKYVVFERDWDTNKSTDNSFNFDSGNESCLDGTGEPKDTVIINYTVNGLTLTTLTYKLAYYTRGSTNSFVSAIYEMVLYEPLRKLVGTGGVTIQLKENNSNLSISSKQTNSVFEETEVKIIGISSTITSEEYVKLGSGAVSPPLSNRVYLQVATDSIWADYDNQAINNQAVKEDYSLLPDVTKRFTFSINGVKYYDLGDARTETLIIDDTENSYKTDVGYGLLLTDYRWLDVELGIYLGTKINEIDGSVVKLFPQGFEKVKENNAIYYQLLAGNIYEQIITESDFRENKLSYPNQIAWSDPYILGSNISGLRNFAATSIINISSEYGKIVNLVYHNNRVFCFTENGVAIINVGEVLTQQSSGDVYIDSTRFLNNYQFIQKYLPDIKSNSIKQYENMLFYGDGRDIWMFTDTTKNITNGRIELNLDDDWYGTIDVINKEYRISDSEKTYSYSIELDEWFGEHSYVNFNNTTYKEETFIISTPNAISLLNEGNTFRGTEYITEIASIANDLNDVSIVKHFRKLYVDMVGVGGNLGYGKEYGVWNTITLDNSKMKNGIKQIGVIGNMSNTTQLFWYITSKNENFVLRMVGLEFLSRNRR